MRLSEKLYIFGAPYNKLSSFLSVLDKKITNRASGGNKMMNFANFNVDRKRNKMATRGPHIQKFVILAATLCLTILGGADSY